jgi:hypothetical protein
MWASEQSEARFVFRDAAAVHRAMSTGARMASVYRRVAVFLVEGARKTCTQKTCTQKTCIF